MKYIDHCEGWGTTSFGGSTSDKLLKVEVPVVSNAVCNLAMSINVSFNHKILASQIKYQITDAMLCAGGELNKSPCGVEQSVKI